MINMTNIRFIETEKKMPLMTLPVRSILVQVAEARILLSPGSMISEEQYRSLGPVTDIVSPNSFHSAGVPRALRHYPKARAWAAPGQKAKRRDIAFTHELGTDPWPYQSQLRAIWLKGMPKINEVVFVHLDSGSLIVCDLIFNIFGAKGLGPRIILGMFGTYNRLAMSRFFAKFVSDKAAFNQSLSEVMSTEFSQIVMAHGLVLSNLAKTSLNEAIHERGFGVLGHPGQA